jgi:hypothetical protein
MVLHRTARRLRDYAASLVMRHQSFTSIIMKIGVVFLAGAALTEGFEFLGDYFDANPEASNFTIKMLLRIGSWGFGISVGLYFLSWLGRHLHVTATYSRKLDIAANIILGALASGLILVLVLVLVMIAYTFLVICITVIKNAVVLLWVWFLTANTC